MHRVPTLVHDGHHIAKSRCRIHENKWNANFRKRIIVSARSFAFTRFEIEVSHFLHYGQALSQERVQPAEYFDRFFGKLVAIRKWLECLTALGVNSLVPGTQRVDFKRLFS